MTGTREVSEPSSVETVVNGDLQIGPPAQKKKLTL